MPRMGQQNARALADVIRAELALRSMSARQMQDRIGVSSSAWHNWFKTLNRDVPMSVVLDIAHEFDMPTSELLRRAEVRAAEMLPAHDDLAEGLRPSERAELDRVRKPQRAEPPASSEQTSRVG